MLQYTLNNQNLPIPEDTQVTIVNHNPICYINENPGAVALDVEIDINEYSRKILGNPERFEKYSEGADRRFPGFVIRHSGCLLASGTLVLTNAGEKYKGWLQSDQGVLSQAQRDKFITDIDMPANEVFDAKDDTWPNPWYNPLIDKYCAVPIKNNVYWEEKGREITEEVPYIDEDGDEQIKNESIGWLTSKHRDDYDYLVNNPYTGDILFKDGFRHDGPGAVISPFPFLYFTNNHIFKTLKWSFNINDYANDSSVINLFIYNNYNLMRTVFYHSEVEVPQYDNLSRKWAYEPVYKITDIDWSLGPVKFQKLFPRISLETFILSVQNFINFVYRFRPDNKIDLLDRNKIFDLDAHDINDYMLGQWENGDRKNVTLKFMTAFDSNDGMHGDEWHDLSDKRHMFKESLQTKADLEAIANPELGELRTVLDENKIYEYKWGVYVGYDPLFFENQVDIVRWEFVSTGPQHFFYGDADEIEEIKTSISPLHVEDELPVALHRGNIDSWPSLWSDFGFRMLFYNQQNGSTTNNFNTLSLSWDGDIGLFKKRWKKFAEFWKNRLPATARFNLPVSEIDRMVNYIHQPHRTRHGEFLIKTMQTSYSVSRVGETKLEVYKK